jgi:hypothetical protein
MSLDFHSLHEKFLFVGRFQASFAVDFSVSSKWCNVEYVAVLVVSCIEAAVAALLATLGFRFTVSSTKYLLTLGILPAS